MTVTTLAIIIIACVYFVVLMGVFGLAMRYSKKHQPFVKVRNEYLKQWQTIKNNLQLESLLTPIPSKFDLPKGEQLYFLILQSQTFLVGNKKQVYKAFDKINDKEVDSNQSYFDDYEVAISKKNYRIKEADSKIASSYQGDIYVTNKRVMFHHLITDAFEQVALNDIHKAYVSVISKYGQHYQGILIQTKTQIYEIICSTPQVVIIINELLKRNKMKRKEVTDDLSNTN